MEQMSNLPAITISRYNALIKKIANLEEEIKKLSKKIDLIEKSLRR